MKKKFLFVSICLLSVSLSAMEGQRLTHRRLKSQDSVESQKERVDLLRQSIMAEGSSVVPPISPVRARMTMSEDGIGDSELQALQNQNRDSAYCCNLCCKLATFCCIDSILAWSVQRMFVYDLDKVGE